MRKINLIPPHTIEARRIRERVRFWIALNLAALFIMAVAFGAALWIVEIQKRAVTSADDRLAELKRLNGLLEGLRGEKDRMVEEQMAIAALLDRLPDCSVLTMISRSVSDEAWLSGMELTRPVRGDGKSERAGTLVLHGHAGSFSHLARLMKNLNTLDFVNGIHLKRSQRSQAEQMGVIAFELECTLVSRL